MYIFGYSNLQAMRIMKTLLLLTALLCCSKKQPPLEVDISYRGKICAHGFVIMVTDQGLEAVYNSDGTPAKCEI